MGLWNFRKNDNDRRKVAGDGHQQVGIYTEINYAKMGVDHTLNMG